MDAYTDPNSHGARHSSDLKTIFANIDHELQLRTFRSTQSQARAEKIRGPELPTSREMWKQFQRIDADNRRPYVTGSGQSRH